MWTGSSSDFQSRVSKPKCPTEHLHRNPKGNYHMVTRLCFAQMCAVDRRSQNKFRSRNFTANHSAAYFSSEWMPASVISAVHIIFVQVSLCVRQWFIRGAELLNWLKVWKTPWSTWPSVSHWPALQQRQAKELRGRWGEKVVEGHLR